MDPFGSFNTQNVAILQKQGNAARKPNASGALLDEDDVFDSIVTGDIS